jgi:hypothetical protein
MNLCGYHLRCSNYGNRCSECRYQHKDKNKDYLQDVLRSWSEGQEPVYAVGPAFAQKDGVTPLQGVFYT